MFQDDEINESRLSAELAAFERQLAGLAPIEPRVDRDRLMFAAGRASAIGVRVETRMPARWIWPIATALSTAAALLLATMLVWQRQDTVHVAAAPPINDTVVATVDAIDVESAIPSPGVWPWADRAPGGYLGVRYVALTQGVGALEREVPAVNGNGFEPSPPATARQLLDELLPQSMRTSS